MTSGQPSASTAHNSGCSTASSALSIATTNAQQQPGRTAALECSSQNLSHRKQRLFGSGNSPSESYYSLPVTLPQDKSRPLPSAWYIATSVVVFVLTISSVFLGKMPGRVVIALSLLVLGGCVAGKVFPQKRLLGMSSSEYFPATVERGKSFVLTIAAWSGGATVLAALLAVVAALLSGATVSERAGWASLWGLVIGGVAGALVWTARQVVLDVKVGRARLQGRPQAQSAEDSASGE